MKSPEREDRQQIVNICLNNKQENINAPEIAKFLQGKQFRDIQNLLQKLTKNIQSENL